MSFRFAAADVREVITDSEANRHDKPKTGVVPIIASGKVRPERLRYPITEARIVAGNKERCI